MEAIDLLRSLTEGVNNKVGKDLTSSEEIEYKVDVSLRGKKEKTEVFVEKAEEKKR